MSAILISTEYTILYCYIVTIILDADLLISTLNESKIVNSNAIYYTDLNRMYYYNNEQPNQWLLIL